MSSSESGLPGPRRGNIAPAVRIRQLLRTHRCKRPIVAYESIRSPYPDHSLSAGGVRIRRPLARQVLTEPNRFAAAEARRERNTCTEAADRTPTLCEIA